MRRFTKMLAIGLAGATAFASLAYADDLNADQLAAPGMQNTINAGTQTRGTEFSKTVQLQLSYQGASHVAVNSTVTLELDTASSSAGVSADDASFSVPSTWTASSSPIASSTTMRYTPGAAEPGGSHGLTVKFKCKSGCDDEAPGVTLNTGGNGVVTVSYTLEALSSSNDAPVVDITNKPSSPVEGNTTGGANVSWGPVNVTDDHDTGLTAMCSDGTSTITSPAFFALGGPYTVTCSATDTGGKTGSDSFTFSVVDTTAPTLGTMPDDITATATSLNGAVVTYTNPDATDIVDPSPTVTCLPASGTTFAPGATTVSCTASDASHNTSAAGTFSVTVTFAWQGFFQPIDGNIRNSMKAGSTAPMKFRITDGGTGFIASTSIVKSSSGVRHTCDAGVADDSLEEYATGGTSLRYDTTNNQFIYNWQSPKQPGACYRVTLVLTDNTAHYADFYLR